MGRAFFNVIYIYIFFCGDEKIKRSNYCVQRGVGGDSLLEGAPPLALLSESVTGDGAEGDVHERVGSGGISPSFIRFFCFIRLFWNHILTCVSFSCKAAAISIRRALVKYLLKWNSFSNSVNCFVVKFVRPVLLAPPRLPNPLLLPPPGLPTPQLLPSPPKPLDKPLPIATTPLPQLGLLPPNPYSGRGAVILREKRKEINQGGRFVGVE